MTKSNCPRELPLQDRGKRERPSLLFSLDSKAISTSILRHTWLAHRLLRPFHQTPLESFRLNSRPTKSRPGNTTILVMMAVHLASSSLSILWDLSFFWTENKDRPMSVFRCWMCQVKSSASSGFKRSAYFRIWEAVKTGAIDGKFKPR